MSEPKGHDMSRHWRMVAVDGGRVTGTWWVTRPDRRGEVHVKPIDVTIWNGPERHWGRFCTDTRGLTAFVKGAELSIPEHMIRGPWRDDALAALDEVAASIRAAVAAVEWEADDE